MQRRFLLAQRRQQIVLIQLANHLALMNGVAHIHRQFLDNPARLALDLHLSYGLDLTRGNHRFRQIDPLHLRQFLRIDLYGFVTNGLQGEKSRPTQHNQSAGDPQPSSAFLYRHNLTKNGIRARREKVRKRLHAESATVFDKTVPPPGNWHDTRVR